MAAAAMISQAALSRMPINFDERPRLRRFLQHVAGMIPCEPEAARVDLHRMSVSELLGRYVNWADRYVAPRPRRVVTWEGFLRHGLPQLHREAVYDLAKKIEAGDDLTPFLSDRIRFGYMPSKRKNTKRRGVEWRDDKDYVLNTFDTHHLHLRPQGSREVLYVIFFRKEAFFVMLGDHKSFDDGALAQAVTKSRVGTALEFKDILGPANPFTMAQQNHLQRYGFSTSYQVGGHTVLGATLVGAGFSLLHTRHADRMIITIMELDPQLDEPGFGREAFERHGRPYPAAPNFEWIMQYCDLCLVETTTHTGLQRVEWRR
ncbi:MAG TPA: hypothetical protein VGZ25_03990 [Gemmataceae bacterium]|nr:hypothetical protein [Gemmataceae bacterium]